MNLLLAIWMFVTITWYHPDLDGNIMANGLPYSRTDTTICASNDYPLGTVLAVYTKNNLTFCLVNDRMAYGIKNRLDMSEAGFSSHTRLADGVIIGKVTNGTK